jgi:hypothetical protein
VPAHALPQQMPCSQNPDMQSDAAAQVPPTGFFPQLPFRHRLPPEQSVLAVQVDLQLPFVSHWNGVHGTVADGTHTPLPSHEGLGVNTAAAHELLPHTVPATYLRQAPAPLHAPSFPQVAAPSSLHWFSGS